MFTNKLIIEAFSESAASRGLNWYVKHCGRQSISHMAEAGAKEVL
ncbi:hypothetical protein [Sphingobacterium athyrii]|nr:hypothetical protein [Sphingobacterium athyrii]